jgi:hypothetical protein
VGHPELVRAALQVMERPYFHVPPFAAYGFKLSGYWFFMDTAAGLYSYLAAVASAFGPRQLDARSPRNRSHAALGARARRSHGRAVLRGLRPLPDRFRVDGPLDERSAREACASRVVNAELVSLELDGRITLGACAVVEREVREFVADRVAKRIPFRFPHGIRGCLSRDHD